MVRPCILPSLVEPLGQDRGVTRHSNSKMEARTRVGPERRTSIGCDRNLPSCHFRRVTTTASHTRSAAIHAGPNSSQLVGPIRPCLPRSSQGACGSRFRNYGVPLQPNILATNYPCDRRPFPSAYPFPVAEIKSPAWYSEACSLWSNPRHSSRATPRSIWLQTCFSEQVQHCLSVFRQAKHLAAYHLFTRI